MLTENIYQQNGYADRTDYLNCLAEEYGVPFDTVQYLADVLRMNEDFDGLPSILEDTERLM